uniref:Nucleophosmin/nucleoplasmin 2 n=1 Tax=Sphenodon punctatus TaxID=8508 RepID=A0A8D0GWQ2_SPHPU
MNSEKRTYVFEIPDEWHYEQQLALRTICLGENAKDEFNVVEFVPPENSKNPTPVPIVTLKPSVLPMATMVGLELTPPVTFRLRAGSGPVYITGQHVTCKLPREDEDEDEEEVEVEEEIQDESPTKPIKRQATTKTAGTAKVQ